MDFGGWAVALNGVLVGSCVDGWDPECGPMLVVDGLTDTPDGLGLPGLRTSDVTFAQRDGVKHFDDFYQPRIITLTGTIGPAGSDCDDCVDIRAQVSALLQAWKRQCDDVELVVYPPCDTVGTDRTFVGPYGVVGRPRVADIKWQYRDQNIADFTLRFDAVDHRMSVLDECGTPGYQSCENLLPSNNTFCRDYDRCYDGPGMCYDNPVGVIVPPTDVTILGTECVSPVIILNPVLTVPRIENVDTGEFIVYQGKVTGFPVIIDTDTMTATQNGVSVTHLLGGSLSFMFDPGVHTIRVLSQDINDTGTVDFCWRDTVIAA